MERLVVITGLAGSGKTLAADSLEDLGYFCVDNLPVGLIHPFCTLIRRGSEALSKAALVIDAREREALDQFPAILAELREQRVPIEVVFFDCSDEVLKRRFSESRRPHPMAAENDTLEQALRSERAALKPLRDVADRILDTSDKTPHQLRGFLKRGFGTSTDRDVPNVNVVSFGFKYGAPTESDLIFDVRFLPNPYFVDQLRHRDGRSAEVQAFLDDVPEAGEFVERLESLFEFLIPLYGAEGKSYLTVSIGCTGGKHRSVAISERLGRFLEKRGWPGGVSHRDLGKE